MPEIESWGMAARDIHNDEDAEAPTLGELVMNEIERPAGVDLGLAWIGDECGVHQSGTLDPTRT